MQNSGETVVIDCLQSFKGKLTNLHYFSYGFQKISLLNTLIFIEKKIL